jgi:prefoldin subunit 2
VLATLASTDTSRKAFRLIGGVLVEKTVGAVLPDVAENLKGIETFLKTMEDQLKAKDIEATAWQKKYNIRTPADKSGGQSAPTISCDTQGQGLLA